MIRLRYPRPKHESSVYCDNCMVTIEFDYEGLSLTRNLAGLHPRMHAYHVDCPACQFRTFIPRDLAEELKNALETYVARLKGKLLAG